MSKILLFAAILAVALCNLHLNIKYRSFVNGDMPFSELIAKEIYGQFHSQYTEKSTYRFKIFVENLLEIRNHNVGKFSWQQGINDFADMTFEEFKAERLMAPQECSATNSFQVKTEVKELGLPENYEWNSFGVVTAVKNQGSCGSCWAFSTVGTMESHWNLLGKGRNITFSEQQLVDCAGDFENNGCEGGLPSHAFEYIRHAGGLESDVTYPYTAKDGQCTFRRNIAVGYVRHGSFNITQGDETELAERLYNAGPIAVSFQVIGGFNRYVSGVYRADNCGTTTLDVNHAVLLTGFGTENGANFWNIKNSWGATWGLAGYFKIERGTNMCALAQCNSYPLIDNDRLVGLESSA
jgi:cathepsin H